MLYILFKPRRYDWVLNELIRLFRAGFLIDLRLVRNELLVRIWSLRWFFRLNKLVIRFDRSIYDHTGLSFLRFFI